MRGISLLFVLSVLLSACESKPTQPTAETTITGYFDNVSGWEVILAEQTPDGIFPIDTAIVQEDGYFQFEPELGDMQIYRVVISPSQFITLAIQKGDHIHMEANGAKVEGYYIDGSEESALISEVAQHFTRHSAKMDSVRSEIARYTAAKNGKELMKLFDYQRELFSEERQFYLDFVQKHPGNLATYFVVSSLQPQEDLDAYILAYNELKKNHPTFQYLPLLKKQIDVFQLASIGSIAPELNFPSPEGDSIPLSLLRGKYVLVDFWASWCKPCRDQNPSVKAIYEKYASRGFEIYGYSLDEEQSRWENAIVADGINWVHTSDLLGWNSKGSADYGVQAIPATFLINPEGVILARDLPIEELDRQLDSLLVQ
jgi:thiol-disulfide isomerase/thioredoxin